MKDERKATTAKALRSDSVATPEKPLARRLRTALNAARGNIEIRQRLKHVTDDPRQLASIREVLGGSHAAFLDLLVISDHTD